MLNPATTADIEARWRPLVGHEITNGQTFLEDGWQMLRRHFTRAGADLEAMISADADLQAEVVRVLATAAARVMKNPDGKRQESIDDYAWTRDQAVSAGLLYFTDAELEDLLPGAAEKGKAFTINPLAGYVWPPA